MSIPGAASPLFLSAAAAADAAGYQIDRSLRFNSADSAYLNRTPSSASSDRTIWTLSFWIKICEFSLNKQVFTVYSDGSNDSVIRINGNNYLEIYNYRSGSYQTQYISNAQFRDPSAWYHFVISANGSTSLNAWVNNEAVTWSTSSGPNGVAWLFNNTGNHQIGRYNTTANSNFYLAEVNWIDGQALAPTDFGEYDDNNVWQPKEFSGTYTTAASSSTTSLSQTGWQTSDQANIWDGNTNTRAVGYADNQPGFVTFSPALTNVTKVEIYQQNYVHYLNGSIVTTSETGTGWHVLYDNSSSPITLTSCGNAYSGSTQTVDIYAIRINGSIVNSQTWTPPSGVGIQGGGVNSFYLKFADNSSNAALGTDSSGNDNTFTVYNLTASELAAVFLNGDTSDLTGSPFNATYALAHLFDSDKTNRIAAAGDSTIVYTPSPAITADKFRFHYQLDSGLSGFGLKVNDVDYTSSLSSGSNQQIDINVQTLTKVEIRTDSSNQWLSLYYIEKLFEGVGAGTDSLIDTPTNYTADSGNNGGNYCTLNPLKNNQTLSNGNLDVVGGSSWQRSVGTIGMYSGKYYWEYTITASDEHLIGVGPPDMQLSGNLGAGDPPGSGYGTELGFVNGTGANGSWSNTGSSGAGDVIGIAFDADNGNMYVYKNGSALNGGIASHTGLVMPQIPVVSLNGSSRSGTINFGQHPFAYTPPTGYVSLCTTNLPDPTIADGSTAFDALLYTGDGQSSKAVTGYGFSPDFLWIKERSSTSDHGLWNTVVGSGKYMSSNLTAAEYATTTELSSIDSAGFTVGSSGMTNQSSQTYVAWAWDAGSSTASNTDGSITSSVRANPSAGFSIVSYDYPASGSFTVGHGLNVAPAFIIIKNRNRATSWFVYHSAATSKDQYLILSGTNAVAASTNFWGTNAPTSTVFGSTVGVTGIDTDESIAYCFAPVAGYSAFGTYTGNGSSDGPFVFTGFRVAWLMIKNASTSGETWTIYDSTRDVDNTAKQRLLPNSSDAESVGSSARFKDLLSNGFKIRGTSGEQNTSGDVYIYAAFAEHPFKTARAR